MENNKMCDEEKCYHGICDENCIFCSNIPKYSENEEIPF